MKPPSRVSLTRLDFVIAVEDEGAKEIGGVWGLGIGVSPLRGRKVEGFGSIHLQRLYLQGIVEGSSP